MNKAEKILSQISDEMLETLEAKGYHPNKQKSSYIKKFKEFSFSFNINVGGGRNSDTVSMHLTLEMSHKGISALYKKVANELKRTGAIDYVPKGMVSVCSLTDWKELYSKEELPNDDIWFTYFSNLEEINEWQKKMNTSFELADKWFLSLTDPKQTIDYNIARNFTVSIELALATIYYFNYSDLLEKFDAIIKKLNANNVDIKEVKSFHKVLVSMAG